MKNSPGWSRVYAAVIVRALQDYARGIDKAECRKFLWNCCNRPENNEKIRYALARIDTGELKPVFLKQKPTSVLRALLEEHESTGHRNNGAELVNG